MKYDILKFITDILSNDKLSTNDKQRIIELAKKDIAHFSFSEDTLSEKVGKVEVKINAIEEKIGMKTQAEEKPAARNKHVMDTIYYTNIRYVPQFLKVLNNNTFTKFLTHDVDSNDYNELKAQFNGSYNYLMHLKKIKEIFSVLTEKESSLKSFYPSLVHISISRNLYRKVSNYINNNDEGWGEEKNKMNWSHPSLLEWIQQHPDHPPAPGNDLGKEGFKFNEITFTDLILKFKNEIHIRKSNSLDFILNKVLFEPQNDFRKKIIIKKDINDSLEFFCDVEKLKQTIRLIFNLIIEKHILPDQPTVVFSFRIFDKKLQLKILHEKSVYGQDSKTVRFGKTSKNLMVLCNGICDLDIEAEFSDGQIYKLPIWTRGMKIEKDIVYLKNNEVRPSNTLKELDSPLNGVLYILTFDNSL